MSPIQRNTSVLRSQETSETPHTAENKSNKKYAGNSLPHQQYFYIMADLAPTEKWVYRITTESEINFYCIVFSKSEEANREELTYTVLNIGGGVLQHITAYQTLC